MALSLLLGFSLLRPIYPREQFLQHGPTALAIAALLVAARKQWLSSTAMTCVLAFLLFHVVGARYIYSYVPFGEQLSWLSLGDEAPGRNHYDRLVHLAFGLLAMQPLAEVSRRHGGLTFWWSCSFAGCFVLGVSALYEVFEWLLTVVAAPEYADNYNGQQGDGWDTQKDMVLAGLGALGALPLVWIGHKRRDSQ